MIISNITRRRKKLFSTKLEKNVRSNKFVRSGSYFVALILIIGIAYTGHAADSVVIAEKQPSTPQNSFLSSLADKPSIDQVAATDLASVLASTVDLPIASNVTNQAISLSAKSELSQTNDETITKPQSTQAVNAVTHDIIIYKTVLGDTVSSVSAKFKLNKETIMWSNDIQGEALEPNRDLIIPPVDGLVATAQNGDTFATIAQKYGADAARLALFNEFDPNAAIPANSQVIVPGGRVVAVVQPTPTRAAAPSSVNYSMFASAGNGYDFGYCTWYAFNRRAQLGMPISGMWGNASSWAGLARSNGFMVSTIPSTGAVMQTANAAGGYGHVAVVESVNEDGSILVSEMNYRGWNQKSTRTLTASEAASYNYIH